VTPSQLPAIDGYVFLCPNRRKHSLEGKIRPSARILETPAYTLGNPA
jgi:hypothetical protein